MCLERSRLSTELMIPVPPIIERLESNSMSKHFRICYLTSIHKDFDARVWKYCLTMVRRRHEVHLVCPWKVQPGEVRDGVTLHPFTRTGNRLLRPFLIPPRMGYALMNVISKVDFIHFHDIDILPWMAALSLVKPMVYDIHENYPEEMLVRSWIPNLARRALYHGVRVGQSMLARMIRNVILVVPEQEDDLPIEHLHSLVVRNYATLNLIDAVALDYFSRPPTVIFIGSQYRENGTFLLLDIATQMLERNPEVKFLMPARWGGPSVRTKAMETIEQRRLTNVELVPFISPGEIIRYLNRGTVALSADLRVPQRVRALPTKLFEYMAAGLPIVASDLPNSVRVLEAGNCGITCRPEEPVTFVEAIDKLVRDREYAFQLGQNGQRAFQECFSWESQTDQLEEFYRALVSGKPRSPYLESDCSK